MKEDATLEQKFWRRVAVGGPDECWDWLGGRFPRGYGAFNFDGSARTAHRFAYLSVKGPIPEGLHIDHLCRNRLCQNPKHLEAVTPRENVLRGENQAARQARQTHCLRGHSLGPDGDVYVSKKGKRQCMTCKKALQRLRYAERGAAK